MDESARRAAMAERRRGGGDRARRRDARVARLPASRDEARRLAFGGAALAALLAAGAVLLSAAPGEARAAGAAVALEDPRIDTGNEKSLQRGARAFVNYCMGCHSAGYARYSRVAQDLGLSEEDVEKNLIFTTDESGEPTKVGALMTNAMTEDYGSQAFGVAPPNLALTARSRGSDWIYTFLKTFYVDPDRAGTGVNNLVYPGTAMPHVLWPLQGWQALEHSEEAAEASAEVEALAPGTEETGAGGASSEDQGGHGAVGPVLTLVEPGTLSPDEYDDLIADITNFLAYLSDPIKETRHRIGIFVMLFLFALLAVTWYLKKEYWKDVV